MAAIDVDHISKSYPLEDASTLDVLDDISFEVPDGAFFSIVGPSGCGKSTLLDIVAGLTNPNKGAITIGDGSTKHRIGFVFQDPTLLDWKTVGENLRFALRGMDIPESEHGDRIDETLDMVGLLDFKDQYPQSLSGGMQQRVGLARAFCVDPEILLMDEPFGSLDEITARKLRTDLLDIWAAEKKTIVFVTHDIHEAVFLSDYIGVMTTKPAELEAVVDIDIPRPRDLGETSLLEYEEVILDHLGLE